MIKLIHSLRNVSNKISTGHPLMDPRTVEMWNKMLNYQNQEKKYINRNNNLEVKLIVERLVSNCLIYRFVSQYKYFGKYFYKNIDLDKFCPYGKKYRIKISMLIENLEKHKINSRIIISKNEKETIDSFNNVKLITGLDGATTFKGSKIKSFDRIFLHDNKNYIRKVSKSKLIFVYLKGTNYKINKIIHFLVTPVKLKNQVIDFDLGIKINVYVNNEIVTNLKLNNLINNRENLESIKIIDSDRDFRGNLDDINLF